MILNVTQDHIDRGRRNDPNSCPVSLALQEALHIEYINVYLTYILICGLENKEILIDTPEELKRFIHDFDEGNSVKPSEFTLSGFSAEDLLR